MKRSLRNLAKLTSAIVVLGGSPFLPPLPVQAQTAIGTNGCPAGTQETSQNFIRNGTFADTTLPGGFVPPAPVPATLQFSSVLPYRGNFVYPDDPIGGLSIQQGNVNYAGGVVQGVPFPGDAALNIPPSNTYLYSNPGNDPANPGTVIQNPTVWQQEITGLQPDTAYNFTAFFFNLLTPAAAGVPPSIILQVTPGPADPPVIAGPTTDVAVRQQWIPIQFAFRTNPGQTAISLRIVDVANNVIGDDFGMTAITLRQCVPVAVGPTDLGLQKSVDNPTVAVGQNVTYTITLTNNGPNNATNITVTDRTPAGLTFVAATPSQGIYDSNTGIWTVGNLNTGASATLRITATLNSATSVTNVATITGVDQPDSNPNNNTAQATVGGPSFRLVKRITAAIRSGNRQTFNDFVDDPNDANDNASGWSQFPPVGVPSISPTDPLQSGDEVEYTVYFLSDGARPVLNSNICDLIPDKTTYVSDTARIQRANSSATPGGTYFTPLAPLPSNNSCTDQTNPNGAVVYELGDIPSTTGDNYGFVRFRVRIN